MNKTRRLYETLRDDMTAIAEDPDTPPRIAQRIAISLLKVNLIDQTKESA